MSAQAIDHIKSLLARKGWQFENIELSRDKTEAVVLWSRDRGEFGIEWATHEFFMPNDEFCFGHYFIRDEQGAINDYRVRCERMRASCDRRAAA